MMNFKQAQALSRMEEAQPEYTRTVLLDSGYGDLAQQWLQAADEFESESQRAQKTDLPGDEADKGLLRAYARKCVSWSRINQLREQALGSIERSRQPV